MTVELIESLRQRTAGGLVALSARTGLSRPAIYRLLGGASPRVEDLRELALAAGVDVRVELRAVSDPLAAVAARLELGDEGLAHWQDDAVEWRDRLRRYVAASRADSPSEAVLVDEAGRASAPTERDGAVHLRGDHRNVDRLVSAGRASGGTWALSGWAALDAMGLDVEAPTIMWVEDVRHTAQLLHDSFRAGRPGGADLVLVPAHPSVFAGATTIEDVVLVAPVQASIDAVGLGADVRATVLSDLWGAS